MTEVNLHHIAIKCSAYSDPGKGILLNSLEAIFNHFPCTGSSMPKAKVLGRPL